MSDALTDDQRDLRHLVVEGKAALAELPIALLPFRAFGPAGLERPPFASGGVVLGTDKRMNGVIHPRERMLRPRGTVATTPPLMPPTNSRRIAANVRE